MEKVPCPICGRREVHLRYRCRSKYGRLYPVVRCRHCRMEFVSPRPKPEELQRYYTMEYFSRRTKRGYDGYLSAEVESVLIDTFRKNLEDIGFAAWERRYRTAYRRRRLSMLDIGCASGIIANEFLQRGWDAEGIDLSGDIVEAGRKRYNLRLHVGDVVEYTDLASPYDLITILATIEHMPDPVAVLGKSARMLRSGGLLVITTCRAGSWNFRRLFGRKWRFYNVPEHLFYFRRRDLDTLCYREGLRRTGFCTYGSGLARPLKRPGDFLAKKLYAGDMMAVGYIQKEGSCDL